MSCNNILDTVTKEVFLVKKKKLLIVLLSAVMSLSGCSLSRQKKKTDNVIKNEVEYVDDMDKLENGGIYIYHDGKYLIPYIGAASFDTASDNSRSSSSGKVAWFMDDWDKIPTMYKGDSLVFYTVNPISENFYIERYEYLGYTIGICGLSKKTSGRYSFNAVNADNGRRSYINRSSDASRLLELDFSDVIIDNIGGSKLRSGNISRAGTILGLEPNKEYAADLYTGTQLNVYVLKADNRALCSMESTMTNDYTFLRSKILRINLPENLNDGYYNVNGTGIFRYVNGTSYTEETNFNIPNKNMTKAKDEFADEQDISADNNATVKEAFTINRDGKITVEVVYGENMKADYAISEPIAKLVGDSTVYTLTNVEDGKMSVTANVTAGEYTLEITGLYGRSYKYTVYQEKERKDEN